MISIFDRLHPVCVDVDVDVNVNVDVDVYFGKRRYDDRGFEFEF
jgi:hypothetical protein